MSIFSGCSKKYEPVTNTLVGIYVLDCDDNDYYPTYVQHHVVQIKENGDVIIIHYARKKHSNEDWSNGTRIEGVLLFDGDNYCIIENGEYEEYKNNNNYKPDVRYAVKDNNGDLLMSPGEPDSESWTEKRSSEYTRTDNPSDLDPPPFHKSYDSYSSSNSSSNDSSKWSGKNYDYDNDNNWDDNEWNDALDDYLDENGY